MSSIPVSPNISHVVGKFRRKKLTKLLWIMWYGAGVQRSLVFPWAHRLCGNLSLSLPLSLSASLALSLSLSLSASLSMPLSRALSLSLCLSLSVSFSFSLSLSSTCVCMCLNCMLLCKYIVYHVYCRAALCLFLFSLTNKCRCQPHRLVASTNSKALAVRERDTRSIY